MVTLPLTSHDLAQVRGSDPHLYEEMNNIYLIHNTPSLGCQKDEMKSTFGVPGMMPTRASPSWSQIFFSASQHIRHLAYL